MWIAVNTGKLAERLAVGVVAYTEPTSYKAACTVKGFVEVTVPGYSVDDFYAHFRMTRSTFEVKTEKGGAHGYISGVHFQNYPNFSIRKSFILKISIFLNDKMGVPRHKPPKYARVCGPIFTLQIAETSTLVNNKWCPSADA